MVLSLDELKKRANADDILYDSFARHLEVDHYGKFVAIARDGRLIIGEDDVEVLRKAMREFGSGNFAFRRIGSKVLGKWRAFFDY
jgi:hypothetical protein